MIPERVLLTPHERRRRQEPAEVLQGSPPREAGTPAAFLLWHRRLQFFDQSLLAGSLCVKCNLFPCCDIRRGPCRRRQPLCEAPFNPSALDRGTRAARGHPAFAAAAAGFRPVSVCYHGLFSPSA